MLALAEMYLHGVSTPKVKEVTEQLCGHEFSASTISRMTQTLDGDLEKFALVNDTRNDVAKLGSRFGTCG